MRLRRLIETECRFHGEMNHDGTIADNIIIKMNIGTALANGCDICRTEDGLFIGSMRLFIDNDLGNGMIRIEEG